MGDRYSTNKAQLTELIAREAFLRQFFLIMTQQRPQIINLV